MNIPGARGASAGSLRISSGVPILRLSVGVVWWPFVFVVVQVV